MGLMTVRELNANISLALARAEAGETIVITKNGEPQAELRPPRRLKDDAWHRARARLEELWEVRWGDGSGAKLTEQDRHGDADL